MAAGRDNVKWGLVARDQDSLTICFSLYFVLEIKLTASMCPTSTL